MRYLDLAQAEPAGNSHRPHEGIEGSNGNEGFDDLTPKGFQCTPCVAQAVTEEPCSHRVGEL
jgi:hypothetical protein